MALECTTECTTCTPLKKTEIAFALSINRRALTSGKISFKSRIESGLGGGKGCLRLHTAEPDTRYLQRTAWYKSYGLHRLVHDLRTARSDTGVSVPLELLGESLGPTEVGLQTKVCPTEPLRKAGATLPEAGWTSEGV